MKGLLGAGQLMTLSLPPLSVHPSSLLPDFSSFLFATVCLAQHSQTDLQTPLHWAAPSITNLE